jgi:serine/threonine protein kinase
LAPEVLNFEQLEYDERADIYSFAIVLWEMASRQTPFLDEYWERFQRNGYFQEKDCQRYPPACMHCSF